MIRFTLFVLLTGVSCFVNADTISVDKIIGHWEQDKPLKITLAINEDMSALFTRQASNGEDFCKIPKDNVEIYSDLYILRCVLEGAPHYTIVISGWNTEYGKAIFGTLYMFMEGQVFNGLSLSLKPRN